MSVSEKNEVTHFGERRITIRGKAAVCQTYTAELSYRMMEKNGHELRRDKGIETE